MGLYPVWNLVQLNTEELAVVTAGRPPDPLSPHVKIISNPRAGGLERPQMATAWEHDGRGGHPRAVVGALGPDALDSDPPMFM